MPGALTPPLQARLARLGASLAFGEAAAVFARFTGVVVSAASARRLTEATGRAAAAAVAAGLLGPAVPAPVGSGPPLLQVSVDGCLVPTIGGWREVKLLAIGTVAAGPDGTARATALSYFGRLADADRFADLAVGETHRRGVATAGAVIGVVDGADWCQGFLDRHRPDAVRVLDFAHAAQRLGPVAEAVWGDGEAARAWAASQRHRLRHEAPERVLGALRQVPVRRAANPTAARVARDEALGYLEPRLEQLRYAAFAARGWPIGSGAVESGHRHVAQARLKGAGRRWAVANVDALLELRTALASGRWDDTWEHAATERQAATRRTATARRQARRPAPAAPPPRVPAPIGPQPRAASAIPAVPRPGPKTILHGRPTAAHPWKRPFHPHQPETAKL